MSTYYGISGLEEARAYLADRVLGTRLIEISLCLLNLPSDDPISVFGEPDDLKLKSSMTLFACADPLNPVFQGVINKFFRGEYCHKTLDRCVQSQQQRDILLALNVKL